MFKKIKVLLKQNWKNIIIKLYLSVYESNDKVILNIPIGLTINKMQDNGSNNIVFDGK